MLETKINNCFIIQNTTNADNRGFFRELYKESILSYRFKQTNCSYSRAGVMRGIHRTPYAKLVTCLSGSIYDVCVDLRINSPTYKQHVGIYLTDQNLYSLFIPEYCGHAFYAVKDSVVIYHQTEEYNKRFDETYCYRSFNIDWPINNKNTIISDRDKNNCYD